MPFAEKNDFDPNLEIPGPAYEAFLEQEYTQSVEDDPDSSVTLGAVVGELLDFVEQYRRGEL